MRRKSPHEFLNKAGSEFISSKHAGLVDDKLTIFIEATSMHVGKR
jgi:hypothetical protein